MHLIIYARTPVKPSYQSLFCPNNRWIIGYRLSKVDFETEAGVIIVLQRHIVHEFGEITKNKGHYAVQGHSSLPILVPIESSYATSY